MQKCWRAMFFYTTLLWTTCSGGVGAVLYEAQHQHRAPEQRAEISQAPTATPAPGDQTMVVTQGENAVLPCHLPIAPASLNTTRVDWHTKDTRQRRNSDVVFRTGPELKVVEREKLVHHFYNGKEDLTHQDPAYHNRARLFTSQLPMGNFSLELRNVSESENLTIYQCVTFDNGKPKFLNNITLLVLLRKDVPTTYDGSPPTDSSGYGRVWHIGTPVAVGIMILVVFAVVVKEKCKSTSSGNSIDLQNGERLQHAQLIAAETRVELEMREDGESRNTEMQRRERESWRSVLCPWRRGTVEEVNNNNNDNNNNKNRIIPASPV